MRDMNGVFSYRVLINGSVIIIVQVEKKIDCH